MIAKGKFYLKNSLLFKIIIIIIIATTIINISSFAVSYFGKSEIRFCMLLQILKFNLL